MENEEKGEGQNKKEQNPKQIQARFLSSGPGPAKEVERTAGEMTRIRTYTRALDAFCQVTAYPVLVLKKQQGLSRFRIEVGTKTRAFIALNCPSPNHKLL